MSVQDVDHCNLGEVWRVSDLLVTESPLPATAMSIEKSKKAEGCNSSACICPALARCVDILLHFWCPLQIQSRIQMTGRAGTPGDRCRSAFGRVWDVVR